MLVWLYWRLDSDQGKTFLASERGDNFKTKTTMSPNKQGYRWWFVSRYDRLVNILNLFLTFKLWFGSLVLSTTTQCFVLHLPILVHMSFWIYCILSSHLICSFSLWLSKWLEWKAYPGCFFVYCCRALHNSFQPTSVLPWQPHRPKRPWPYRWHQLPLTGTYCARL